MILSTLILTSYHRHHHCLHQDGHSGLRHILQLDLALYLMLFADHP